MRHERLNRSVARALLGLLAAVVATVLTPASPASAEAPCCQVSIDNLPAQFTVGSPTPFTVHVVNQTPERLRYLRVSFLFQAEGLVGDLVDLKRQRLSGGPHDVGTFTQHGVHSGAVTATELIDLGVLTMPPGGGVDITYQLWFSPKMPSTALTLSTAVQPRRDDKSVSSAGPYQASIVAVGEPLQTESPTPSPIVSDTPAEDTAAAGQSPLAGTASSGSGGSLTWLVYAIGALLLLGGVGMIGMLMWRRGPQRDDADEDEPQQYAQAAYPHAPGYGAPRRAANPGVYGAPSHHTAPTAQYPIPQDPYTDDPTWGDPPAGR
jgi:hypothetical protein